MTVQGEQKAAVQVQEKKALSPIMAVLMSDNMKKQFNAALPKVLPVDRFLRILISQFSRVPELNQCDKMSVLSAAMTAAQLGLEIDPALGRAYLLPYNDRKKGKVAQLIIGYKGYIDLAYRSGQVSGIQAEVVYEKDFFEYSYGLDEKLVHVPAETDDRGALKYAWAKVTLQNGGVIWRVLNKADINRHKSFSKSAGSDYSPWNTSEPEMWRKTAIRAIAAMMPLSPELRDAVSSDEVSDHANTAADALYAGAIDVTAETVESEPAPSLSEAANG